MNEVVMLRGAEPREILQAAIEKRIPAIMSYLSKGKWHVAKVLLTNLGANRLSVEVGPQSRHTGFERASCNTSQDGNPNVGTGASEGDSILQKDRKMDPSRP